MNIVMSKGIHPGMPHLNVQLNHFSKSGWKRFEQESNTFYTLWLNCLFLKILELILNIFNSLSSDVSVPDVL